MSLKQKGTVQDYTARFQDAAYTAEGHSDLTLRTFYYQELKDEIKEAMTYHEEPETLNDIIKLAVLMDKRRSERWFDKKGYHANTSESRRPRHTQEGGDAMELDAAEKGEQGKKGKRGRRQWTQEEKDLYSKGLCTRCTAKWEPGHRCSQRNGKSKTAAAAETTAQDEEEPRSASTMSREVNHAALSWTACFNDSCQTHKSDKDATGWYPSEPRQLNLATRNEEVLEIDDLIDDLPYDDELVNSDTGELYNSTLESSEAGSTEQWQDQAILSRIMEHLS